MTGPSVPDGDMPNLPWPGRGDVPAAEAAAVDAMLAGDHVPDHAAPGLRLAADVLAALTAAPDASELAGEHRAMAEFRKLAGMPGESRQPHRQPRRRRPTLLPQFLSAKAALATAAAVTALGGAAGAAYAGSLPASLQTMAHDTIGAPSPQQSGAGPSTHSAPSATPVGPDATGAAAYGLCTAYEHAKAHGSVSQKSVAFRNLATAAGGADKVDAYCATVAHPGSPAAQPSHPNGSASSHPTGKPTAAPSAGHTGGAPTSGPEGQPNTHPSGPPTVVPSS